MAHLTKEIVLVTGGNTGLGLEVVRKLVRDYGERFHVIIGSRSLSKGEGAAEELQKEGHQGVEAMQLDITSEESLAAAAKLVTEKFGRLDVLHANAGIAGDKDHPDRIAMPLSELIMLAMRTNAAGSAASVEHFVPLLSKSSNPRVIFISSGAGSLKLAHDFGFVKQYPAYCASKVAENMLMLYYSHRFPEWKVNASNPGFRATKINNYGAGVDEKPGPLEEGALNAVRLTLLGKDGESGTHTQLPHKNVYSEGLEGNEKFVTVPW